MVPVLAIIVYLMYYPLMWFENKFIMGDVLRRPLWYTHSAQQKFRIVKNCILICGTVLIVIAFNWIYAVIACAVSCFINRQTLLKSLEMELIYQAEQIFQGMQRWEEYMDLSDTEKRMKAIEMARVVINNNIKGYSMSLNR